MSFSWISVSCYILLRVNKYILASKKHILSYCCVYFMISLSFPSVYLCLYLQYPVNLILSVSFLCVIVLCCFLDLVGLHPSLLKPISLSLSVCHFSALVCRCLPVLLLIFLFLCETPCTYSTDISIVMLTVSFGFPHSLPSAFTR